jgi:chemotaxis protein MotB
LARKKRAPPPENHERWLISYADFITLLFAFFVVMFAASQADKGRAQMVSDSVKRALQGEKLSSMIAAVLGGSADNAGKGNAMMRGPGGAQKATEEKKDPKVAELVPSMEMLTAELKADIDAGRIQVNMEPRGLVVSFKQAALFPSGEDEVSPEAYGGLEKVAGAISKLPNPVRLEGHTDSVPISTARFRSNWELSAARAIAIMDLLSKRFNLPRERLSIAGYADNAPVASNDSDAGRARNRRVDVVILNEQGVIGEPGKPEAAQPEAGKAAPGSAGAARK